MFSNLRIPNKVKELAQSLQDDYRLTAYEALDIALKAEKNQILSRAFVLSDSDSNPTALEKLIHSIEERA